MTAESVNQRKHSMGSVADKIAKKILTSRGFPPTGANPAEPGAGTPAALRVTNNLDRAKATNRHPERAR